VNIPDALTDLKNSLADTEDRQALLKEIAESYGLRPELLRRKFEEQHGVSVDEWSPPTDIIQTSRERAQEKAIKEANDMWSRLYSYECDIDPGFLFEVSNREYALISISRGKEMTAIRVIDQEQIHFRFRGETHAYVIDFIKKNAVNTDGS
jgi:hypothetical protein